MPDITNFYNLLKDAEKRSPRAVAILDVHGKVLEYHSLVQQIEAIAECLNGAGIGQGDRVATVIENGPEAAVGCLGISARATCAPLNPACSPAEFEFYLRDLAPAALLADSRLSSPAVAVAQSMGIPVIQMSIRPNESAGTFYLEHEIAKRNPKQNGFSKADDIAMLLYTTGTASRPKIVPLTHASLCRSARINAETLALTADDRCLNVMPLFHIHGLIFAVLSSLTAGASVVCTPSFDALHFFSWLETFRPTWYTAVPTIHYAVLGRAVESQQPIRSSLRFIRSGASGLPASTMAELEQVFGVPVIEAYAMTEAGLISINKLPPEKRKPNSVGLPIGCELAVMDEQRRFLPAGQVGDIIIRGGSVIRGYENNPEANQKSFLDGWFYTGDQGKLDSDGYLFLTGRTSETINRGGEKIAPFEIDEALMQHTAVRQAIAFPVPHASLGQQVAACVVLRSDATAVKHDMMEFELQEFVAQRLAMFKVPYRIIFVAEIPKGPTGKPQRKGLATMLGLAGQASSESVINISPIAPLHSTQERLMAIWRTVLGHENFGVEDDFFHLGGDSISGARLMVRIGEEFGESLPLFRLFRTPTLRGLAEWLESTKKDNKPNFECFERIPRPERLPLSYAQQRLWFLQQYETNQSLYNIPTVVRLRGPLNIGALEQAISEVVNRHEALRTSFQVVEGNPVQVIRPAEKISLRVWDLTGMHEEKKQERKSQIIAEQIGTPFSLETNPLLRAELVREGEQDHVLVVVMHHISSDGWSLGIFTRELAQLYESFSNGRASTLEELPVQYADYALWQKKRLQGELLERQLEYWKKQLADAPELLELSIAKPRPAVQSHEGSYCNFEISQELFANVQELSHREGVTLFMVMLAAFQLLLQRYSGQQEIVVGSPIAGRNCKEVEGLIGFFVNTLALRTKLAGNPNFYELLGRVKKTALEAYSNQDVPFERLVEELQPERNLSRSALFQVMLVLQNTPATKWELAGLALEQEEVATKIARFDLAIQLREEQGHLQGRLTYRKDLYEDNAIRRLTEHLETLLRNAITTPDARINDLGMLTQKELHQVIQQWQGERIVSPYACVHELFEQQAELTPEAVAAADDERQITYAELNRKANQLAHELRQIGVGPEVRVGLCLDRRLELVIAVLAVLKAGGAYVPLEPNSPVERLRYMLQDAGVNILLLQEGLQHKAGDYKGKIIVVRSEEAATRPANNLEPISEPRNLAYVLYTSGSTGEPKGVAIEHRQLVNYIHTMLKRMGSKPCSFAMVQPLSVDASVTALLPPLLSGGCVHIISRELSLDPAGMSRLFRKHAMRGLKIAPSHLIALHAGAGDKSEVMPRDILVIGGEVSQWNWMKELQEVAPECVVINHYGPTETTVGVLTYKFETKDQEKGYGTSPLGQPLGNTQVYVLDGDMNPVGLGMAGEIYIGGENVGRGYFSWPEMTAEKFVPDTFSGTAGGRLYRSGDTGRWLEDGQIEFLGRQDDQVKVRGYRIELGEIETVVLGHEGISQAAVVVREDAHGEKKLVGYVAVNQGHEITESELRAWVEKRLPEYMTPKEWMVLDELPRKAHGKLDRAALPEPRGEAARKAEVGTIDEPVALELTLEEIITGIWSEVLHRGKLKRDENFFALGGHSLLAMQVIARIREVLRVEIPVRRLFEEPTIMGLATKVEDELRRHKGREAGAIRKVSRDRDLPLSFAQQRLWFLQEYEERKSLYNIATVIRLRGKLNVKALESAISEIISRHESLRTRLALRDDGNPMQVIDHAVPFHMTTTTLLASEQPEKERQLRQIIQEQSEHIFDLFRGPLLRGLLVRISELEHVFILVMHHIVSDGWSSGLFTRELAALYERNIGKTTASLPELPIQYPDYAAWQREWLESGVLEEQLTYWRKQLGIPGKPLDFPKAKLRPTLPKHAGSRHYFEIDSTTMEQLQQVARQESVTLFMTLLSAFQILLCRYSGQTDLSIGTPIAGRSRRELEGLIGCFVNTLVLRTDLTGEPTAAQCMARVREVCLDAYAHQDVPFEKLVEELEPQRDSKHTPFFQTMLILQNQPRAEWKLPDLELVQEFVEVNNAKFDLTLSFNEQLGGRLRARLEYRAQLFDEPAIARMGQHFLVLLQNMLAYPKRRISELGYLTDTEREQLLVDWNHSKVAFSSPYGIHHLFEQQAERRPDSVAITYEGQQLNYRELNEKANQLAHFLRVSGVGPEARVGLCLERSLDMVIALLGVLKAGGAYVPIDPQYPSHRISYILKDSAAALVITTEELLSRISSVSCGTYICIDICRDVIARSNKQNPVHNIDPQNTAYVIYTSGSTGEPRGVMVPHSNVVRLLTETHHWFNFDECDTWTLFHSYAFDFSVWELWGALAYGGRLVVIPHLTSRSPQAFRELLWSEKVTVLNQTPSAFWQLMQADREADQDQKLSLRLVIFGGETLDIKGLRPWFDTHGSEQPQLINMYGITETTVHVTHRRIRKEDTESAGSLVGWRIGDLQLYVLDQRMEPVAVGVAGELYVGGAGLARGYLNQPALTAERFVPDPFGTQPGARLYQTGDLGRFLEDSDIEYLGRADQQVKVRGFRIELGEIKAGLECFPQIEQAVVIATARESGEKRLVGYYVPRASIEPGMLQRYLRTVLPEYMVPSALVLLEEIPLTANGKVDFKALPQPDLQPPNIGTYVAPRTVKESLLALLWGDLLEIEEPGVEDNFFDLGGDSILSIRLLTAARQQGLQFTLVDLFDHPTIAELAKIAKLEHRIEPSTATKLNPNDQIDQLQMPQGIEAAYPMTQMQTGMVFQHELNNEGAHYLNFTSLHLRAPWNLGAMEKALGELMQRHPVLRTSFDMANYSVPLQLVHRKAQVPLYLEDLRTMSSSEQEHALAKWEKAQKQKRFEVRNAPLFCIYVHLRSDETFQLGIVEHHAILDGWSVAILQSELLSSYAAEIQKRPTKLKNDINDVFRSYVRLEQQALQSIVDSTYWHKQLEGSQSINLPRRIERRGVDEPVYRNQISFSEEICSKLRQVSRRAGVPLKSVLLAAHMRVLTTLAGQRDILTGLVMHGRPEMKSADQALGLFLNTLPLRLQMEDCSWLDLARKSFQAEREMIPHRYYPMASIVQQSENLPLETLFNFVHFHVLGKVDIFPVEILGKRSFASTEFALAVNCSQNESGLDIKLLFQPDYFTHARAQEITAYYQAAIDAICANPDQKYESCSLLSERELRQVVTEWNATEVSYPKKCLHECFEEQVKKTPDSRAVEYKGSFWTYWELNQRANQVAALLGTYGVGPEVRVGVCLERGLELISTLLGILKAGGAYVALDPAYPQSRLKHMISDSQIQIILTQDGMKQHFPKTDATIVKIEDARQIPEQEWKNPEKRITDKNLAYVIYTSGSTGQPKGVAIEHSSAVLLMNWAKDVFTPEDLQGVFAGTSVSFDLSVFEIFAPLSWGGKVILGSNTMELREAARSSHITLVNTVPSVIRELLRSHALPATTRVVNLAGEPLSQELVEQLYRCRHIERVFDLYGPSEDTTYSTFALRNAAGVATIGRPIANTQTYILNEAMQPQVVGVAGELYIGGAGLARGYLAQPALTAERFIPNPFSTREGARLYQTGDLARWNEEGNLEYLGRMDGQVKIRGYRIECGEVESALRQCAGIKEAVVAVRENNGDRRLAAYLVTDDSYNLEVAAIRRILLEKLPEFMVPSWIIRLERLPLNSNGKVDRKVLAQNHFEAINENKKAHEAPANATEELVAAIWAEVLKVEQVGRNDHFFELGGHSLLVMQVIARIRNVFREEVDLLALFEQPVLADFVVHMARKEKKPGRLEKIARIFLTSNEEEEAASGAYL
jgi:amino acid adenylation domain-containing protein